MRCREAAERAGRATVSLSEPDTLEMFEPAVIEKFGEPRSSRAAA